MSEAVGPPRRSLRSRRATIDEDGVRSAIGHIFTVEQWDEAHVRLFSEWLRANPADRDRYSALKTTLVARGTWGSDYTSAKAGLVLDIVNRARSARGLAALSDPL